MHAEAPAMPGLTVRALDAASMPAWDGWVAGHPEATFFHRAGWKKVIEASFRHRCHFLLAEAEGNIRGVLPLVHVRSRLFGNALVSNAFCVYGGPLAADEAAGRALDDAALDLARSLRVDHLEYRLRPRLQPDGQPHPHTAPWRDSWACNTDLYATFRKEMDPDPEKNLLAIPRKQRAVVRKGIKNNLQARIETDLDRFFPLYAESRRDLGTPIFPKRLFENLMSEFGQDCEVVTVFEGSRPVSTLMTFYFRNEVLPYYGAGAAAARTCAAYDFMYWDVMRRACEQGYRIFDFGRSKRDTGAWAFKKHWGFEPQPLQYQYKLLKRQSVPDVNPSNPRYQLLISLWKRLPIPLANAIGPAFSRSLG
jgi:FemAB-related protein (PEP-CTERM system-associated)